MSCSKSSINSRASRSRASLCQHTTAPRGPVRLDNKIKMPSADAGRYITFRNSNVPAFVSPLSLQSLTGCRIHYTPRQPALCVALARSAASAICIYRSDRRVRVFGCAPSKRSPARRWSSRSRAPVHTAGAGKTSICKGSHKATRCPRTASGTPTASHKVTSLQICCDLLLRYYKSRLRS